MFIVLPICQRNTILAWNLLPSASPPFLLSPCHNAEDKGLVIVVTDI